VVSSRLRFANFLSLTENNPFRTSQLREAAKRWLQALCDNIKLIKKYYEN